MEMIFLRSHHLLLLTLCALFAYGPVGCSSQEAKKAQFMEQARESRESGDLGAALIGYRNALNIDPNDASTHFELAKTYEGLEDYGKAHWEFGEAARLNPDELAFRQAAANYALIALEWEMALGHADAIVAREPGNSAAHVTRGVALERLERMEEAEAAYLRAIEVLSSADDGAALGALAAFYDRRDERGKAAEYFERWARELPSFDSYTHLARFQLSDLSLDESTEVALNAALAEAEGDQVPVAVGNLFQFHALRGRNEKAERVLLGAIQRYAGQDIQLSLYFHLARFRAVGGDVRAGAEILERAVVDNPDDVRALLLLSSYRELTGDLASALATATQAQAAHPDSVEAEIRVAELLIEEGRQAGHELKAEQGGALLDGVLEQHPGNSTALLVKGKRALYRGEAEEAEAAANAVLMLRPNLPAAYHLLGMSLYQQSDPSAARAALRQAIELDPHHLPALRLLALIEHEQGNYDEVVLHGQKVLQQRPRDTELQVLVVESLVNTDRVDEAAAQLDSLPAGIQDLRTVYARARIYMQRSEWSDAHRSLLAAAASRPDNSDLLLALHQVELQLGKEADSIARIQAALERNPESSSLRTLRGIAYESAGDPAQALEEFQLAIALDPANTRAVYHLSSTLARSNRRAEAAQALERAIEDLPNDADLHGWLASLLAETDLRAALPVFERVLALDPGRIEAKADLAYVLAETAVADDHETLQRAVRLAEAAHEALPNSLPITDTLGWVSLKAGQSDAAIVHLEHVAEQVSEADPNRALYFYHLGAVYESVGESRKAFKAYQRAVLGLSSGQASNADSQLASNIHNGLKRLRTQGAR